MPETKNPEANINPDVPKESPASVEEPGSVETPDAEVPVQEKPAAESTPEIETAQPKQKETTETTSGPDIQEQKEWTPEKKAEWVQNYPGGKEALKQTLQQLNEKSQQLIEAVKKPGISGETIKRLNKSSYRIMAQIREIHKKAPTSILKESKKQDEPEQEPNMQTQKKPEIDEYGDIKTEQEVQPQQDFDESGRVLNQEEQPQASTEETGQKEQEIMSVEQRNSYYQENKESLDSYLSEVQEAINNLSIELKNKGVGEAAIATDQTQKFDFPSTSVKELMEKGLLDWRNKQAITEQKTLTSPEAIKKYPKLAQELAEYQKDFLDYAEGLPREVVDQYFPGLFETVYPNGVPGEEISEEPLPTETEKQKDEIVKIKVANPEAVEQEDQQGTTLYLNEPIELPNGKKLEKISLNTNNEYLKDLDLQQIAVITDSGSGPAHTQTRPGDFYNWEVVKRISLVPQEGDKILVDKENLSLKKPEKTESLDDHENIQTEHARRGDASEHALHGDYEEEYQPDKEPEAETEIADKGEETAEVAVKAPEIETIEDIKFPLVVETGEELDIDEFLNKPGSQKAVETIRNILKELKQENSETSVEKLLSQIQEIADRSGYFSDPSVRTSTALKVLSGLDRNNVRSVIGSMAVDVVRYQNAQQEYQHQLEEYQQKIQAFEQQTGNVKEQRTKIQKSGERQSLASQIDWSLENITGEMQALSEERKGFSETPFMDLQTLQIVSQKLTPILQTGELTTEQVKEKLKTVIQNADTENNPFNTEENPELNQAWEEFNRLRSLSFEQFMDEYFTEEEKQQGRSFTKQGDKLRTRWTRKVGEGKDGSPRELRMSDISEHVLKGLTLFERRRAVDVPEFPDKPTSPERPDILKSKTIPERKFIQNKDTLESLPDQEKVTVYEQIGIPKDDLEIEEKAEASDLETSTETPTSQTEYPDVEYEDTEYEENTHTEEYDDSEDITVSGKEPEPELSEVFRAALAAAPRAEVEMARDMGMLERTETVGSQKGVLSYVRKHFKNSSGFLNKMGSVFTGAVEAYKEAGFFKRAKEFAVRVWKHDLAKEYFDFRATADAQKRIEQEENIFAGQAGMEAHRKAMTEMAQRFLPEAEDIFAKKKELITSSGERVVLLNPEADTFHKGIVDSLRNLAIEYAASGLMPDAQTIEGFEIPTQGMTEEGFISKVHDYAREIAKKKPELLPSSLFYGDTLLETANEMKTWLHHQAGRARIEGDLQETLEQCLGELSETELQVALGTAHFGARTKQERNITEQAVEKIIKNKPELSILGKTINVGLHETTLSAIAAGVTSAAKLPARFAGLTLRLTGNQELASLVSAGTMPVFTTAVGGIRGFFHEMGRLKVERTAVSRWSAQEREIPEKTPTQEFTRFLYNTKEIDSEILQPLDAVLQKDRLTEQDVINASAIIAEAKARISLNNEHEIDTLIVGLEQSEGKKSDLVSNLAEAEVRLQQYSKEHDEITIEPDNLIADLTDYHRNKLLDGVSNDVDTAEIQGIKEINKSFNRWRVKRSGLRAVSRAAQGFVISALAQEGVHLFREKVLGHELETVPLIEKGLQKLGILKEAAPPPELGPTVAMALDDGEKAFLPEGSSFEINEATDTVDITLPNGEKITNISQDIDAIKNTLEDHGVSTLRTSVATISRPEVIQEPTEKAYDALERLRIGHEQASLEIPEGTHLQATGKDTYSLLTNNEDIPLLKNIQLNSDGEIVNQAVIRQQVQKSGLLDFSSRKRYIQDGETTTRVTKKISEWIHNAKGVKSVIRRGWWDNMTPDGPYEYSELGLAIPKVDEAGNVIQSFRDLGDATSTQLPGTSLNVGQFVKQNAAKLIITPSSADTSRTFVFEFNASGVARIPAESPVAQLFEDGKFLGAYVEIAQIKDAAEGVTDIMPVATYKGTDSVGEIVTEETVPNIIEVPKAAIDLVRPVTKIVEEQLKSISFALPQKIQEITAWPPSIFRPGRRALEMGEKEQHSPSLVSPIYEDEYAEEYPDYYQEYPEYQEFVVSKTSYPEHEIKSKKFEYPEYEAIKNIPTYEELYNSLEISEAEKQELRRLSPKKRIKEIARKTKVSLSETPIVEQIKQIQDKLRIQPKENLPSTVSFETEVRIEENAVYTETTAGKTEKGGRSTDEDGIFVDGNFILNAEDIKTLEDQLQINAKELEGKYNKLKKEGKIDNISIVADGMGGYHGGEIHSSAIVLATVQNLVSKVEKGYSINEDLLKQALIKADSITNNLSAVPHGSGSTITISLQQGNNVVGANIGDTRGYKIGKDGKVELLTDDDSLVWKQTIQGVITPTEMITHPQRSGILAAIEKGRKLDENKISTFSIEIKKGERVLLCCDGVWEGIEPKEKAARTLEEIYRQILNERNISQEWRKLTPEARREITREIYAKHLEQHISEMETPEQIVNTLTNKESGIYSGDNVSAVCFENTDKTGKKKQERLDKRESSHQTPEKLIKERLQAQDNYLNRLKERWTLESSNPRVLKTLYRLNGGERSFFAELKQINSQLPPMKEECRFSIVIPAYLEEQNIQDTLKDWVEQFTENGEPLDPDLFEIIVLINRPNKDVEFDETYEKIQELKEHPDYQRYNIHTIKKTFNFPPSGKAEEVKFGDKTVTVKGGVRMGLVYTLPADLVVLRNSKRKNSEEKANLLMKTGGADAFARNPEYINRVLKLSEQSPQIEQYNFRADFSPEIYEHIPLLHVVERFREIMNLQYTQRKSLLGCGVYRSSLYSEAGGFNPDYRLAEEIDLNKRLRKSIRKKASEKKLKPKDLWRRGRYLMALDDPRRNLAAIWEGLPMHYSYLQFEDRERISDKGIDSILKQPLPPNAELTKENMQMHFETYIRYYLRLLYLYGHKEENNPVDTKNDFAASCQKLREYLDRTFFFLGLPENSYQLRFDQEIDQCQSFQEAAERLEIDFSSENKATRLKDLLKEGVHLEIKDIEALKPLLEKYKQREHPEWVTK